jgi:O-antigen ligase
MPEPVVVAPANVPATAGQRLASRVVQFGAIVVVLAATVHRMFDLDRFFVPKEFVLHLTAALAGLLLLRRLRASSRADWALIGFLAWSAISALFAQNQWMAIRALAVSASGVMLFWIARALREANLERRVYKGIAAAVVLACITSLLQAYGLDLDVFSKSRAPGGTLGNRNFVAHAAAFGLPVVLLCALRARNALMYFIGASGVALVTASLVLTRSRAAWLAFAAMALVFLLGMFKWDNRTRLRFIGILILLGAAVAAALTLPNHLNWRSDNPYLETAKGVVNYEEGSGRGRLIQYQRSLIMAAKNPLFGVGPGNWAVEYPAHAPRRDPSLDPSVGGMTFNPWPSSDWIAFISERGLIATVLLAFAFAIIAFSAFRKTDPLEGTALLATVVAALVAGTFDAVLLLGLPSLLIWTTLGALYEPRAESGRGWLPLLILPLAMLGVFRSGSQLLAMEIFAANSDRASLDRAASLDPGNYRLRLRLARSGKKAARCEHAKAAKALYPQADAARALAARCD